MYTCLQIHNDYLIPGGETKSVNLIAEVLEKSGFCVVRYYKSNKDLATDNLTGKIRSAINWIYNKDTVKELQGIIENNHIDFALVHNTSPIISNSVYEVLIRNNIPIYKYLQNYNMICLNGALDRGEICAKCVEKSFIGVRNKCYKNSMLYTFFKYLSKKALWKKYLHKITGFIAISDFVKNQHSKYGLNEEKIHVLYHFCEAPAKIYANQNTEKYVVYMGRLSSEKGIMTLIDAMKGLPNISLKILGKGDLENEIKRKLSQERIDNVFLLGFKTGEEKNQIVGNACVLVAPSEWEEPFGRIAIEAYQVGTPVIGSSMGGLKELILDSVTGYQFEAGNSNDLREKIQKICSLSDSDMQIYRENCVRIVDEKFSEDVYIQKFSEITCKREIV